MGHWTFVTLGKVFLKDNCHVDRHSRQESDGIRDSEYLVSILRVEELKVSSHDFCSARTFLESLLDLSIKRCETAFGGEGEDSAQRIFDFDGSLEIGEASVDAKNIGFEFKYDGIYLLSRHT